MPESNNGVLLARVGFKIKLNVYLGDRPLCQCHSEADAALIVTALNGLGELQAENGHLREAVRKLHAALSGLIYKHPNGIWYVYAYTIAGAIDTAGAALEGAEALAGGKKEG